MHLLHAEVAPHELGREPIEQLRVLRLSSQISKIVGGLVQSFAEVPQPQAIDGHAGEHGIFGRRQPVGERLDPPLAEVDPGRLEGSARGNLMVLLGTVGITARQDVAFLQFFSRVDFDRPEYGIGSADGLLLDLVQPILELLISLPLRRGHDLLDLWRIDTQDREIIVGDPLLIDCALFLGFLDDGAYFGRQERDAALVQLSLIWVDQRTYRRLQRRAPLFDLVERPAMGKDLRRRSQDYFLEDERIKERFHPIEVPLFDRIVHVVMTFGAAGGQSHESAGDRLGGSERQLFGIGGISANVAAQETPERTCRRGGVPNGSACQEPRL